MTMANMVATGSRVIARAFNKCHKIWQKAFIFLKTIKQNQNAIKKSRHYGDCCFAISQL